MRVQARGGMWTGNSRARAQYKAAASSVNMPLERDSAAALHLRAEPLAFLCVALLAARPKTMSAALNTLVWLMSPLPLQRTGSISILSVRMAGGLTMVFATECCQKQKREAGRSLLRNVILTGQISPASTPCLRWKCWSTSWLTVRSVMQSRYFVLYLLSTLNAKFCGVCVSSYLTDSGGSTEVWIGLWKQALLPAVEWSDGSPVTLTLWHQYHPLHNLTDGTLCTKVDRKVGNPVLV